MPKKIKIRKNNAKQDAILANWHPINKEDAELTKELYDFLEKNEISFRTNHFWKPKSKGIFKGKKFLNYITFYKEEDINFFKLAFSDRLRIEEYA